MNSRFAILLVALLALAVFAPAGSASSPPNPVCPVCGDGFERTAESHGIELQVTETQTTVAVDRNGDAKWTVRNRIADERHLDRMRNRSTLVDQMASEALDDLDGAWNAETNVDDGVVTIRFRVRNFATRTPGGVLRVDYLNAGNGITKRMGENDTLRVTGPDGYAVTHAPTESQVTDGAAEWTGRSYYGQRETVTFAQGGGAAANLWTNLSLALRIGGVIYGNLVRLSPAWLLFGLLLSGLTVGRRFDVRASVRSLHRREAVAIGLAAIFGLMHLLELVRGISYFVFVMQIAVVIVSLLVVLRGRTPTVDRTTAALLAFGVAAIVYPIYDSPSSVIVTVKTSVHTLVFSVGLLYLLAGTLARYTTFFEDRERQFEHLFMPLAVAPLAVVPAMFLILFFLAPHSPSPIDFIINTFEGALPALPVGLFLPLGYRSRTETERGTAALAAGIFAAYLLHVSLSTDIAKLKLNMGIGAGLDVMVMAVLGLAIVAFGLPLYFLGRALGNRNSASFGKSSGSTPD